MLRRLGYVSTSLSIDARANHTLVLRRVSKDRLRALIKKNFEGLGEILKFNLRHRILLFRMSSQVIPFGGHPVNDLDWCVEFQEDFQHLGAFVRRHDMRLSFHPGQYTTLASPDLTITKAAIRDLRWHAAFLDCLGLDTANKVVVHVGGAYGDKEGTMARWAERYVNLPKVVKRRLVLENDEWIYAVKDVLKISAWVGIPVVFDYLHHQANPGGVEGPPTELMQQCFQSWKKKDGPPKIHFSSQRVPGRRGAHADYVEADEFIRFLKLAPADPYDCMLEAKAKDLALFRLLQSLETRGISDTPANRGDHPHCYAP